MAAFSLTSAYIYLNGTTDISSYVKSVTLSVEANELETTNFLSAGWKTVTAGLKSGSVQLTMNQDVAAGALEATLWPLFASVISFEIRPTNAAVSTANPKWTGSLLLREWSGVNGAVGDLAEVSVTWPLSGAVTRATA